MFSSSCDTGCGCSPNPVHWQTASMGINFKTVHRKVIKHGDLQTADTCADRRVKRQRNVSDRHMLSLHKTEEMIAFTQVDMVLVSLDSHGYATVFTVA